MARILVVEDDERLGKLLVELLAYSGHEATVEARGDHAVEQIIITDPDMVVLDIGLPGLDGFEVCRQVRPSYRGPVLVLTARGDVLDEVIGLDAGADAYLAKPVEPQRLMAHVRALLRRGRPSEQREIVLGELVVDAGQRCATLAGEELTLSSTEFDLLWAMALHAGEPMSRDELHDVIRGGAWDGVDRTVDLRISRLRRALGDDPAAPRWLLTVRGVGYQLARR